MADKKITIKPSDMERLRELMRQEEEKLDAADPSDAELAAMEEEPLDDTALESEMKEGLARWWQQARRSGRPAPAADEAGEEARRLQQLDYVRQRLASAEQPDGRAPEGPS